VWNKFHFLKFCSLVCGIAFIDFSCFLDYSLASQNYTEPFVYCVHRLQVSTWAPEARGSGIGLLIHW